MSIKVLIASFFLFSSISHANYISDDEVKKSQIEWGKGIIEIGNSIDYRKAAVEHIEKFYAYDTGKVLFKPTLASENQFRGSKKLALSYFIGQDLDEDTGFALAPYTKVRWENEGIVTNGRTAMAMGNYFFTKIDGEELKVEYTFGYIKDKNGNIKINLHHSSIPYSIEEQ